MTTTMLVRKCQDCGVHRSRLNVCHVCDKKLCGGCSFKRNNGKIVCSGGGTCHQASKTEG
jgi:hypothetical protein